MISILYCIVLSAPITENTANDCAQQTGEGQHFKVFDSTVLNTDSLPIGGLKSTGCKAKQVGASTTERAKEIFSKLWPF